jgi:hypothetical protein
MEKKMERRNQIEHWKERRLFRLYICSEKEVVLIDITYLKFNLKLLCTYRIKWCWRIILVWCGCKFTQTHSKPKPNKMLQCRTIMMEFFQTLSFQVKWNWKWPTNSRERLGVIDTDCQNMNEWLAECLKYGLINFSFNWTMMDTNRNWESIENIPWFSDLVLES